MGSKSSKIRDSKPRHAKSKRSAPTPRPIKNISVPIKPTPHVLTRPKHKPTGPVPGPAPDPRTYHAQNYARRPPPPPVPRCLQRKPVPPPASKSIKRKPVPTKYPPKPPAEVARFEAMAMPALPGQNHMPARKTVTAAQKPMIKAAPRYQTPAKKTVTAAQKPMIIAAPRYAAPQQAKMSMVGSPASQYHSGLKARLSRPYTDAVAVPQQARYHKATMDKKGRLWVENVVTGQIIRAKDMPKNGATYEGFNDMKLMK